MILLSILIIVTLVSIVLILLGKCKKISYSKRDDLSSAGWIVFIFTAIIGWLILGMLIPYKSTETIISKKDLTIQIIETKVVVVNKVDNSLQSFSDTRDYLIIKDSIDFNYVRIKDYNLYHLPVATKFELRKN